MTNRHKKKKPLKVIKEMENKMTLKHNLMPITMAILKGKMKQSLVKV